jgi:hypothetical protein
VVIFLDYWGWYYPGACASGFLWSGMFTTVLMGGEKKSKLRLFSFEWQRGCGIIGQVGGTTVFGGNKNVA